MAGKIPNRRTEITYKAESGRTSLQDKAKSNATRTLYGKCGGYMNDFHFKRVVIPMNTRNSNASGTIGCIKNGTPLCPKNGLTFLFVGKTGSKHRSSRLKFVCPGYKQIGSTRVCICDTPCTNLSYGKCVYVYPDKDLRLYPGISHDYQEFSAIYNRRISVEHSIYSIKDTLGIANRKTSNSLTTKADLFLAGIVQLRCVLLAEKLHDAKLARRPRRLIA